MAVVETYFIGIDGEDPVSGAETRKQIVAVRELKCAFFHKGEPLTWDVFDDPYEPRTVFQSILKDRELRVDKKMSVSDRPAYCVITAVDGRAVRMEYYEGDKILELCYDLRSKELQGKPLLIYMNEDPELYDPKKIMEEAGVLS